MKNLITISLLLLYISAFCKANENDSILIKGITTNSGIVDEYKRLDYVSINVYQNNSILTTLNSDNNGKFEFSIPVNSYITLEFKKDNFISKRILFDTRLAPTLKKIRPFNLEITMLNDIKEINTTDMDFPITRVEYSEEAQDFIFVEQYTERMINKQNGILAKMAE